MSVGELRLALIGAEAMCESIAGFRDRIPWHEIAGIKGRVRAAVRMGIGNGVIDVRRVAM